MIPAAYSLQALSPLGTTGLGLTGGYGSYNMYMPYSMMNGYGLGLGMDSSIFGLNGYGMGLGGYGYMNSMLQYPLLYNQMQEQIEKNQLNHSIEMQEGMNRYGVAAHKSSDRAVFEKIANNGQVKYGIDNLYRKVVEGDQDGIVKQFKDVRNYILQTYSNELNHLGNEINPVATANEAIKTIYASTVLEATGQLADLETDIKKYGDNAIKNGFYQGFRNGHHKTYVDETLRSCFGRDIDQKEYKDHMQGIAKGAGRAAQVVEKGAIGAGIGAAVGAGTYILGGGVASVAKKAFGGDFIKFSLKSLGKWGILCGLAAGAVAFVGDIIWQASGSSKSAA